MKVGGLPVNLNEFQGTRIGNGIEDAVSGVGTGASFLHNLAKGLPSHVDRIELTKVATGTWSNKIEDGALKVSINPKSDISKYSPGSLFGHELAHKVEYIDKAAAARTDNYIKDNPDAYESLVEIFGNEEDARFAINYGFEESIITKLDDNYRFAVGGPARGWVSPAEAIIAFAAHYDVAERKDFSGIELPEPTASISFLNSKFAALISKIPDDPLLALDFASGVEEAIQEGSHKRENGSVEFWNDGVTIGQTSPNSYYSDNFLNEYGTVNASGHASARFGGHVRALGDWLGFDGQFGLQGSFAEPGEGKNGVSIPNSLLAAVAVAVSSQPKTPQKTKTQDNYGGYSSGGDVSHEGNYGRSGGDVGTGLSGEDRPLILDLDGSGVELTQLSTSTVFVDSSGDGLLNRTAWAAAGNGVLFYDADGDGTISEKREYVFTEWDPTATSDIEALRAVFDSNGDGVFDANDDKWGDFKVLVTNADGSLEAKTLAEVGITSIDLTADATNIELPDGSVITGKTTFTYRYHADADLGYRLNLADKPLNGKVAKNPTVLGPGRALRVVEAEVVDADKDPVFVEDRGAGGALGGVAGVSEVCVRDASGYWRGANGAVEQGNLLREIAGVLNDCECAVGRGRGVR